MLGSFTNYGFLRDYEKEDMMSPPAGDAMYVYSSSPGEITSVADEV